MTLSRWRKADPTFSKKIDEVLEVSRESINDLAESKMIQGINNGNSSLIRFWLGHNSSRYRKSPDVNQQFYITDQQLGKDDLDALINAMPEMIKNNKNLKND